MSDVAAVPEWLDLAEYRRMARRVRALERQRDEERATVRVLRIQIACHKLGIAIDSPAGELFAASYDGTLDRDELQQATAEWFRQGQWQPDASEWQPDDAQLGTQRVSDLLRSTTSTENDYAPGRDDADG